jgi:hypothetical protein
VSDALAIGDARYIANAIAVVARVHNLNKGAESSTTVEVGLSGSFVDSALACAQVQERTISEQIEYWSKIGKIAEENPDLTFSLIKEILAADSDPIVGEYICR